MFDERFFRMWEFYLAGCEMAFKWGDQVVYQFQLTKNYTQKLKLKKETKLKVKKKII